MQKYFELLPQTCDTAVALGYFDGLHLGHRRVIENTAKEKANGLKPVCFTFKESPKSVLSAQPVPALMTMEDKIKTLESLGIDCVYFSDFREIMNMRAEDFVCKILIGRLRAKRLFCGFNYRFGKGGEGDVNLLSSLCEKNGAKLTVASPCKSDGETVSSTLIRRLITEGEISRANSLLCTRFGFSSVIEHGKRLGRTLGTPTINQPLNEALAVPKFGVYASIVTLDNGESYYGVTNIGVKPTVGSFSPVCETWMPEYKGEEIYGKTTDIRLIEFIRPEKKFDNLDALKNAIIADGKTAKQIYNNAPHN